MHEFVSFNSDLVSTSEVKISAISSSGLYGKGVFTTLAVFDSKPFLWDKHWRRLKNHARQLKIDLTAFSEEAVTHSLLAIIKKNNVFRGKSRLTFFDESESETWNSGAHRGTSLLIQTADLIAVKMDMSVNVSPFVVNSKSPIAGIKSCNYLENISALNEATENGFDEALRYNQKGELVSFCMANVFWTEKGSDKLFTPGRATGCLAGTTREIISERYEVAEVEKDIDQFTRDVERIFITSSGLGVVQIASLDGIKLSTKQHGIGSVIQNELN